MIELINEDYADFVNLSGNLIGLDKAIAKIQAELSFVLNSIKVMLAKQYKDLEFSKMFN